MFFDRPMTLMETVRLLLEKELMPTSLDTQGIRALDASLRNQSFFSAQTTSRYLLEKYRDFVASLLQPGQGGMVPALNPTYARVGIQNFLGEMGYRAAPGEEGTLTDLRSDARVNLVLKTNVEMAQGQGWWLAGQSEPILDQWPAQELFRAEARNVPRDWIARWRLAGAASGDRIGTGWTITSEEKLVALKNHKIWGKIGSSELFQDGLDQSWPPFAFNSGMWVRDVERAEAEELGLISRGERVMPMSVGEAFGESGKVGK